MRVGRCEPCVCRQQKQQSDTDPVGVSNPTKDRVQVRSVSSQPAVSASRVGL